MLSTEGTASSPLHRYPERLVITKPVTIRAAPGQAVELSWDSNQPYEATVEVDAAANPGAGLEAPGAVVLQGLRLRHSSPSVANNYAVRLAVSLPAACWLSCLLPAALRRATCACCTRARTTQPRRCCSIQFGCAPVTFFSLQGCGAVLIDCDVTSSTGDGVGVEGGAPRLQGCTVHDCVRHGAPCMQGGKR